MRKSIYNILIASLVLGVSAGSLQAQDTEQTIRERTRQQEREDRLREREKERLDREQRQLNRQQTDATRVDRDSFEQKTRELNALARKGGRMDFALKTISIETGVPLERVQAMHKKHPDQGVGGLLNACVLAAETKKDPEDFFRQHARGKGWVELARENKVPLEKLTVRLDHMERAISGGAATRDRKK